MNKIVLEVVCLIFIPRVTTISDEEPKHPDPFEHWTYDYCTMECNGTMHTMCKYPAGGGDACDNNLKVYLTREEKAYIEDNLNGIRLLVATGKFGLPHASNMMKLVWDQELSAIAKRWADQCTQPLHDKCRITADEMETGQTVVIGKYANHAKGHEARMVRIKHNLEIWEKEKDHFIPATLANYDPKEENTTGNFTQIIWGTTEFVGCGYTEFQMKGYVTSRFVCNFKRGGNIPYSYVYRTGEPCTACPARTVCSESFKGMCWNKKFGNYVPQPGEDGGSRWKSPAASVILSSALLSLYR